jgi:hypothetical protein
MHLKICVARICVVRICVARIFWRALGLSATNAPHPQSNILNHNITPAAHHRGNDKGLWASSNPENLRMYTRAGTIKDVYAALTAEITRAGITIKPAPNGNNLLKICLNVFGFVADQLLLTAHSCDGYSFQQQQLFFSDFLFGVSSDAAGDISARHLATIPIAEGERLNYYTPESAGAGSSTYKWQDTFKISNIAVPLSMVRTAASGDYYTYLVFATPANSTAEAAALVAYADYTNGYSQAKYDEYNRQLNAIFLPTQLRLGVAKTQWNSGASPPTVALTTATLDMGAYDPLVAGIEVIWSGPERLIFASRKRSSEDYSYSSCAAQTSYSSFCFFVVQDPKLEFWSSWSSVKRYAKVYELAYNGGSPALATLLDFSTSAFSGKVVTSLSVTIEADGVNIFFSGSDATSGFALYGKRTGAGAVSQTTVPYEGTPQFLVRVE